MRVFLKYLVFGLYRTIYGNFFPLLFNSRVQIEAGGGDKSQVDKSLARVRITIFLLSFFYFSFLETRFLCVVLLV